ncbi:expressed unknown protein [Seminavis robusta]|uniref:Uncharacterized protein n=1 Tax=Seminavis robusta TaxID=568900 RepID=A0A9N8E3N6_9STRA|nr:expressed unknown protein [Seminavis robusta]|eukprot:Sro521_g159310.1 n/a (304) ;mRNA; f:22756-23667
MHNNRIFFLFMTTALCSARVARALSSSSSIASFTSCATPRFDTFSEKLVGTWKWQDSTGTDREEAVGEVMRSCGGAVQGIREIPSLLATETGTAINTEEGFYANRANDGFRYFEDGSYTCGPVNDGLEDSLWISSLTIGKSRLILAAKNPQNLEDTTICQVVTKKSDPTPTPEPKVLHHVPENIVWEHILRCRMPSVSQPWMAQRLKWEQVLQTPATLVDDTNIGRVDKGWVSTTSANGPAFNGIFETMGDDSSIVLSAGGICSNTGIVKSIARQYVHENGSTKLKGVAWLKGTVLAENKGTQ